MLNLLMSSRARRSARRLLGTVTAAVRSVVNPAALVADQAEPVAPAVVEAPDPAGLYEADEMPAIEDIEAAAHRYAKALDLARAGDRGKRGAKKVLTRVPSGVFNGWKIYRKPSARMTPDLEAIGRILREHGIREIPMKPCADSLVVERVEAAPVVVEVLAGVAA